MRWRGITEGEVVDCNNNSHLEQPARRGKIHSWQALGMKYLRVTWIEESGVIMVITAVIKQRAPEGW